MPDEPKTPGEAPGTPPPTPPPTDPDTNGEGGPPDTGNPPPSAADAERAAKIAAAKAKAEAAKAARAAAGDAPKAAEGAPADAAAPKPAAARPKPEPKKPAGMTIVDISGDSLIDALKAKFGDAVQEALLIGDQQVVRVKREAAHDLLDYLKNEADPSFNLLVDLTAAHYPDRNGFEMIYQLYSIDALRRLRVKSDVPEGEAIPTVSDIWSTANWLEREVYDLFGVRFDGHPDLRRILLPEGWIGHPMRKEHPVEYHENEWVAKNLNILEIPADADLTGKFE